MEKKFYEFTGEVKTIKEVGELEFNNRFSFANPDVKVKQIRYLSGDHKGELGGWIESEDNFISGYIGEYVVLCGSTRVKDSNIYNGCIINSFISGVNDMYCSWVYESDIQLKHETIYMNGEIRHSTLFGDIEVRGEFNIHNCEISTSEHLVLYGSNHLSLKGIKHINDKTSHYDMISLDHPSLEYDISTSMKYTAFNINYTTLNDGRKRYRAYKFKSLLVAEDVISCRCDTSVYVTDTKTENMETFAVTCKTGIESAGSGDYYILHLCRHGDYEEYNSASWNLDKIRTGNFHVDISDELREKVFRVTGICIPEEKTLEEIYKMYSLIKRFKEVLG